jgi:hypothetical protein
MGCCRGDLGQENPRGTRSVKAMGIIAIERPKQITKKVVCPVCKKTISLERPELYNHLIFYNRHGKRIVCPVRAIKILKTKRR